jgi:anti-sigma factor RsiW
MEEQLQEDWLDARLRDEAPYIDDAGFTARVMQQLPPARQRRSVRSVILVGMTVLACVFAFVFAGEFLATTATFLVAMPLATIAALAVAAGLMVTAFGTTMAVARVRGDRL